MRSKLFPYSIERMHRFSVIYLVFVYLILVETRAGVILTRRAKKLRKTTGDQRYKAKLEETRPTIRHLIWISCTRPMCKYLVHTKFEVLNGIGRFIAYRANCYECFCE